MAATTTTHVLTELPRALEQQLWMIRAQRSPSG